MRITPSSSFILATLAISSSSSSLAAPTEHNALERSAYPSSSRINSALVAARGDTYSMEFGNADNRHDGTSQSIADVKMSTHDRRQLGALLDVLDGLPVVGGILNGLLNNVFDLLGLEKKGAATVESTLSAVTPDQLQKLVGLFSGAAQQIQNATGSVVSGNNHARSVAGDTLESASFSSSSTASNASYTTASSSFSMQPSATSVEAMGVPTVPSGVPELPVSPPVGKNGTAPASPQLPANPPNTPIPPGTPQPPVPAGAAPPSGPIPGNLPPMLAGFKAADVSTTSSASLEPCASVSSTMASASASCTSIMTASSSATMMSSSAASTSSA
ncbi:hypothetical protein C8Q70DRAFT_521252 [Cubamyces menziesii]|uniref:Uncharacterized protein n=1 Tax=Trametes cubensis TaxID=1111947 RepID=A0AAD7U373_9APHY|nr:hypothetical protein C8Q70DRAFT_521252 [Cubamyces menziesii]KAJ8496730.1 hypothetical protein ONZ51_g935 [Trametes cubensis]